MNELNILTVQQRRTKFVTPTKRLEINKICKIAPPRWNKDKQKKFFGCNSDPPIIASQSDNEYVCSICGFEVDRYENSIKCKGCVKHVHLKCMRILDIGTVEFRCSQITRHLGEDSTEILGPKVPRPETPVRRFKTCIICGDEASHGDLSKCSNNCSFRAHKTCAIWLKRLTKLRSIKSLNSIFTTDDSEFCCSNVQYQLKPEEIFQLNIADLNNKEACLKIMTKLNKELTTRGKVNTLKYTRNAKRYLNEEVQCKHCKNFHGFEQMEHELRFCRAINASPVTSANCMYPLSRLKRMRLMFTDHFI